MRQWLKIFPSIGLVLIALVIICAFPFGIWCLWNDPIQYNTYTHSIGFEHAVITVSLTDKFFPLAAMFLCSCVTAPLGCLMFIAGIRSFTFG